MSSAIEVLNVWVNKPIIFDERFMTKDEYVEQVDLKIAIKEALLALEQKENYVIDFIRLESLPKSKKEQFRVFFKDGTEQVFENERVGGQK